MVWLLERIEFVDSYLPFDVQIKWLNILASFSSFLGVQ